MPATFGPSGAIIGGTATDPGIEPGRNFTLQGTGDGGAGPYTFTMRLTDYPGQQATQQYTLTIRR